MRNSIAAVPVLVLLLAAAQFDQACYGQDRACCLPDGTCVDMPKADCLAQGGENGGRDTSCGLFVCGCPGESEGCSVACCFGNGNCYDLSPSYCVSQGATPQEDGASCQTFVCACTTAPEDCVFRVCCLPGGTCFDLPKDQCLARGGSNAAWGTECETFACPCPNEPAGCDDGLACTIDACEPIGDACVFTPDDSLCSDGLFCNGAETCDSVLGCQPGTPPDCNDGISCTVDSCNDAVGACQHASDDSLCDDGVFCNGAETCDSVLGCQPGTPPDCNDGVFCTIDSCDPTSDACLQVPDDLPCDDSLFCTGVETCDAGLDCQSSSTPCAEGQFCREDMDACVQCLIDAHCNDGLFCNGVEICENDVCGPGAPPVCDDDTSCTIDSCNEETDACDNTPSDSLCDDGAYCNGVETCDPINDCQSGLPVNCDDGVSCTIDVCDEINDVCINAPENNLCNDGAFCNGVEVCDMINDCMPGSAPNCDDGVDCTDDTCDETDNACMHAADDSACEDGDPCTQGTCAPFGCEYSAVCRSCCLPDLTCVDLEEPACLALAGVSGAVGTVCAMFICGCPNDPFGCDDCPGEPVLVRPDEPGSERTCDDAVDNDCDGLTDREDDDCAVLECPYACGDLDDDLTVNLSDFVLFADCYGRSTTSSVECACSDLNADGSVNLLDFSIFANFFNSNEALLSCNDGDPCTRDACFSDGCGYTRLCRACCLDSAACMDLLKADCLALGGANGGRRTECGTFICGCPEDPEGCLAACCFPDGNCYDDDPQDCQAIGGTPQSEGTSCQDLVCACESAPEDCAFRACCLPDGTCLDLPKNQCRARNGTNGANGTSCDLFVCGCPDDPEGCPTACCRPEEPCIDVHPHTCLHLGGQLRDPGTLCPPESAVVFFVAQNDPNADDCNPGTEDLPWRTLSRATKTAQAGDTILVKAGVYNETLRPANSGAPGALITFMANPGEECQGGYTKTNCQVILDGESSRGTAIDLFPQSHIRVEGFEVRNYLGNVVVVQVPGNGTITEGIQLVNNFLHDCGGWGVYARGSTRNLLVENNEIRDVYRGVQASSPGGGPRPDGLVLRANHIWRTYCDGFRGGGDNFIFEYNHIHSAHPTGCHRDALDMSNMNNLIIRYNTIYDYTQLVYLHEMDGPSSNIEVYGNLVYLNQYPGSSTGRAPGIFFATFDAVPLSNVNIHSNTFGWVGYNSVRIFGTDVHGVVLRNNIFIDGGIGIGIGNPDEVDSDYNLFFTTPGSDREAIPWLNEGPHSITADPQFTGYERFLSHDFHLLLTSPAIDAGDPNLGDVFVLPVPFLDLDGNTRPMDVIGLQPDGANAYDLGVYEQLGG